MCRQSRPQPSKQNLRARRSNWGAPPRISPPSQSRNEQAAAGGRCSLQIERLPGSTIGMDALVRGASYRMSLAASLAYALLSCMSMQPQAGAVVRRSSTTAPAMPGIPEVIVCTRCLIVLKHRNLALSDYHKSPLP